VKDYVYLSSEQVNISDRFQTLGINVFTLIAPTCWPVGELAPAITATINFTGHLIDFVVTHMGNDGDNLDRKVQAEFLSEELRKA